MPKPLVLRIDKVHPELDRTLREHGFFTEADLQSSAFELALRYPDTECLVVRSRLKIDRDFLLRFPRLRCIVRVGSGLEGIDTAFARSRHIAVFNTPEGNRNAVAEHATGLIWALLRRPFQAFEDIRQGKWLREAYRGYELEGKTVGIIGYGNTGKALARKLAGFDTEVLAYDIVPGLGDEYARQTDMDEIFERADIVSLHVPLTPLTFHLVDGPWIERFAKPFWLVNTARGEVVHIPALLRALESDKIRGAALDVLPYEQKFFGDQTDLKKWPDEFRTLVRHPRVILTPHIAGLTHESNVKLARTAARKIIDYFARSAGHNLDDQSE